MEKTFALLCPDEENSASVAVILVIDDDFDYPHIMLSEIDFKGNDVLAKGKYRFVCLHQSGGVVSFLQSFEEKITDEIERLIELMQLSPKETEREYQKEFLYYWNAVSHNDNAQLFLRNTNEYAKIGVYQGEKIRRSAGEKIPGKQDRKIPKGFDQHRDPVFYGGYVYCRHLLEGNVRQQVGQDSKRLCSPCQPCGKVC